MSKSPSATSQVSKEAAHEYAMKLTNDVLQNREPVAAAVLVWGWILKQVSTSIKERDSIPPHLLRPILAYDDTKIDMLLTLFILPLLFLLLTLYHLLYDDHFICRFPFPYTIIDLYIQSTLVF